MNDRKKSKRFVKAVIALIVVVSLAAGLNAFKSYFYGDPAAPYYLVPEEWQAYLSVIDEKVNVSLKWDVDILKIDPGHVTMVQLFPIGTVFREVKMNDEDVLPVKRDGWFCVEVKRPGAYSMSADIDIRVEEKDNLTSVRFRKPFFLHSVVHVDSEDVLEFTVDNVVGKVTGSEGNGTHGAIHAGLHSDIVVTWRTPRERVEQIGVPSIKPSIAWSVSDRAISASALLNVTVMGGTREMISLILPEGADRIDLKSRVVREWRKADDQIDIYFTEKVAGEFALNMSFEIPGGKDIAECSMFQVEGGRLEAGGWLLAINDTSGVMLENNISGLQAVSDLDVAPEVMNLAKGKPLFFYKVIDRNAGPVFDVVTKKPFPIVDTIADRLDILAVVRDGGEEITRLSYRIRNNSRQFLRLEMPQNSKLIYVEVDSVRRQVSEQDGTLLIPLVRSIQTLGGLVPFPIEVVYCRQGMMVTDDDKFNLDLPELPEVPVAHVTAKVFYPNDLSLDSYASSLGRVEKFSVEDALSFWDAPLILSGTDRNMSGWVDEALMYNNYELGYDAYKRNDLKSAEQYFEKTQSMSSHSALISKTSKDLLSNLMVGRGEIKGKDKLEKAKILSIQGQLAGDVDEIQAQQEMLIQAGLANINEGDEELGAELLREAEGLGYEVSRRGGSALRQKSVSRHYQDQLEDIDDQRRYNRELNEKLERLQKKAQTVLTAAPENKKAKEQARSFAKGVIIAAKEEEVSLENMPVADIAWSGPAKKRNYSKRAEASQVKGGISSSGTSYWKNSFKKRDASDSLKEKNKGLLQKVSILNRAFSAMSSGEADGAPAQVDTGIVRKSLSSLKSDLSGARDRIQALASQPAAMNDYIAAEKELADLEQKAQNSKVSFGALDDTFQQELVELEEEARVLKVQVSDKRAEQQKQPVIAINVGSVVNTDNPNSKRALQDFFGKNYGYSLSSASDLFIDGDNLVVPNEGNAPEQFNRVVEKIQDNSGNAVTVAGNTLNLNLDGVPAIVSWFSNTTATGKKYAILDEAQYRTLAQADSLLSRENAEPRTMEKKEVILGTGNSVNGIEFELSGASNDYNGLLVDGSEINIEHDQYYAVADGGQISVLKAGELHNWQDEGEDINMEVSVPYKLDIPQVGAVVHFEKTLLSVGESPDIEISFNRI